MARRIRPWQVCQVEKAALGTGTGTVALTGICAPSPGASIDRVEIAQVVAGTGTGTYDIKLQLAGTSTDVTAAKTGVDADAAAGTNHGAFRGNGTKVAAGGRALEIDVVVNGTVSGAATVGIAVWWNA